MTVSEEIAECVKKQCIEMGLDRKPSYGSVMVQINFEAGQKVITVRERETIKSHK
jgi:hypothetical protein